MTERRTLVPRRCEKLPRVLGDESVDDRPFGRPLSSPLARNRRGMASTYVKEFTVPPEMPEVLRDFTREVLRDQPTDINSYGYHYFMGKIREREEKIGAGELDETS